MNATPEAADTAPGLAGLCVALAAFQLIGESSGLEAAVYGLSDRLWILGVAPLHDVGFWLGTWEYDPTLASRVYAVSYLALGAVAYRRARPAAWVALAAFGANLLGFWLVLVVWGPGPGGFPLETALYSVVSVAGAWLAGRRLLASPRRSDRGTDG